MHALEAPTLERLEASPEGLEAPYACSGSGVHLEASGVSKVLPMLAQCGLMS